MKFLKKLGSIVEVPAGAQVLVAAVSSTVGLLLSQSLISNSVAKLVTGMAAIWIPLGYLGVVAILHLAHSRVVAARISMGQPVQRLTD